MGILKSSQFLPPLQGRPKVLVTGANGFVGSHLAERLAEIGCDLYLLLRTTSRLHSIRNLHYTPILGDLRAGDRLARFLPEIDYIFHSAGLIKARSREEFMEVNAGGTRKLVELARQHCKHLKRFVYISTQAAAGPSESQSLKSEVDDCSPVSDYGLSKLEGEKAVLAVREQLPVTVVRPPAVFGERDQEMLQIFQSVKAGLILKFGRKESFISIAYVKDLIDGIMRAGFKEEGRGEVFFINSVDELSQWQAQLLMADTMKVDIRPLVIPLWLLRTLAGTIERFENSQGRASMISRDKVKELSCRYWLSSSEKAQNLLEYKPLMSVEESLRQTYDWYVENRML